MASPAEGSIPALINQGLNGLGTAGSWVLEKTGNALFKTGHVIAPGVLGWTGGWIMGVGTELGLFQGAVSGIYHIVIHDPVADWCDKYKGTGPTQIHPNTIAFLKVVGAVAGIALPIFLTYRYGDSAMSWLTSGLSQDGTLKWLLTSEHTHEYTVLRGVGVAVMPAIAQHWISKWRSVDVTQRDNASSRRY